MKKQYLLLFFIWVNCITIQAQNQQHQKRDEQWALALIKALPETKQFMKDAKRDKPKVIIAGTPDSTNKYYWVKEGIDNYDMFRTSTDYFIDPTTNKIFVWDKMNVTDNKEMNLVSLHLMRKWGSTHGWAKPHIFKGSKLIIVKDNNDQNKSSSFNR
jgi:hypothetical protein